VCEVVEQELFVVVTARPQAGVVRLRALGDLVDDRIGIGMLFQLGPQAQQE
jgi:hypothetical protein